MVKIGISKDVREGVTVLRRFVSWWGGVMVMVRSKGA